MAKCGTAWVIVNTARGSLIDPDALIDASESGRVGAAALDVLENETACTTTNHAGDVLANRELALLRSFPNVIVSPHTAFYTDGGCGQHGAGAP